MIDIYDPIWELMDIFSRQSKKTKLCDTGLKDVIKRPHNLVNIYDTADSNGKVIAQRIDVVTTPFKKNDIKVTISNNILTVSCGLTNIEDDSKEDVVYRGISSQSYIFSLNLSPIVNQDKITAENSDGVLKITLPIKTIEPEVTKQININID